MNIDKCDIRKILDNYNIDEEIKDLEKIIEYYSEDKTRAKFIIKVDTDKSFYIVKLIVEDEHPMELIEEQSIFSESMRYNNIITPKRYKSKDRYTSMFIKSDMEFVVTVEDYIGEELDFINEEIVKDIALLMANMHRISEKNHCHTKSDTIWNIFSDSSDISRGYRAFCEYGKLEKYDFNKYNIELYYEIINLYNNRLSRLKSKWRELPKYASQGDYSTNNMTYRNGRLAIFDYNIAGDEVLVSDMIIEGCLVAYEMDLAKGLDNEDRDRLFTLFVKEYVEYRRLNSLEIDVMDDIYAIIYPFWWTRIIFDEEESLKSYLDREDTSKVNRFLEDTYRLLKEDFGFEKLINI